MTLELKLDNPHIYMGAVASALRKAATEYALCPEGHIRVGADMKHAEANSQELLASTLRRALQDAKRDQERYVALAKAIEDALDKKRESA